MKKTYIEKDFLKKMISIALPITVQNLISSSLNMVDTIMIGRLGEERIAAVGLANQFFFLMILLVFGLNSGAAIFISQFWGSKNISNIHRAMGISLVSGGILSLGFTLGALIMPQEIIGIFIRDRVVIELGVKYLTIVSLSYIPTAISFTFAVSSRSVGNAKLPMKVSILSLLTNTLLNYILIFGKFGFPEMGIRGAAIATVISRFIELIVLVGVIYSSRDVLAGRIKEFFNLDKIFIKRVFKTAFPVVLNEGLWALGMTLYTIAYGRIGPNAVASIQISQTVEKIFMVLSFGLGSACGVMIGNELGANKIDKAVNYSYNFSAIGIVSGLLLGLLLFLTSPFILLLFNVSRVVSRDASLILRILAGAMFLKTYNTILIIGVFRGGGDTKYSLLLEMGSIYLLGVPLAFLGAIVWKLPVYIVVLLVTIEEVIKAALGTRRMISKKWAKNIVQDMN